MTAVARALAIAATRLDAAAGLGALIGDDAAAARALVGTTFEPLDDPRPRGWRHVDPSWIDHAVAGEDAAVRAIVVGDRVDPLARWLARWFLGAVVPMPSPGPARGVDELPRLSARGLARTLDALGRRQLAWALAATTAAEQTSLAARLPWGHALAGEIAAVRSLGDAAATSQLGSRTSALVRTASLAWSEPTAALVAGLRAIAPRLRGRGDRAAQLCQRLPHRVGAAAWIELTGGFATAPADAVADVEVARAIARADG